MRESIIPSSSSSAYFDASRFETFLDGSGRRRVNLATSHRSYLSLTTRLGWAGDVPANEIDEAYITYRKSLGEPGAPHPGLRHVDAALRRAHAGRHPAHWLGTLPQPHELASAVLVTKRTTRSSAVAFWV
ncbi:hypothetical protein EIP91_003168 [Steccherinum ochraceum]|uniref:Uncharacterized protein n=1 Tax=Steccherinum ochraceum TaxID=92696 RepID=A0A4R0RXQ5_9APHY|nr:hypothetical protein EIP91_003168 [Steccherinum ochraceum]